MNQPFLGYALTNPLYEDAYYNTCVPGSVLESLGQLSSLCAYCYNAAV